VFFLLGGGARQAALKEHVNKNGLDNVIIADERPVADVPYLIARSDVCFASVLPAPYPRKVISVKIFEYLACEKPVVGSLAGESAVVVERSGGGINVQPGDSRAVADAILDLFHDPARRAAMGKAGRRYVEENFSRGAWASKLERKISSIGAGPSPGAEVAIMHGEVSASPSATE
jgi:glycosyltransferase involved in cell wall biosynthesis